MDSTNTKKKRGHEHMEDLQDEGMGWASTTTTRGRRKTTARRPGEGHHPNEGANEQFLRNKESLWQQGIEQINEQSDRKIRAILDKKTNNVGELKFAIAEHLRSQDEMESRYKRTPGKVIGMGSDDANQLGQLTKDTEDDEKKEVYRPVPVKLEHSDFIQVKAGGMHSLALTNDGTVYSWGCNDEGALGRETENPLEEAVAAKINGEFFDPEDNGQIVGLSVGDSHSLFLTLRGNVYMSGMFKDSDSGKFRNIPAGSPHEDCQGTHKVPIKVGGFKQPVRAIASGMSFNAAILQDNSLVTWGMGHNGELARSADMTNSTRNDDGNLTYDLGKPFYTEVVGEGKDERLVFLTKVVAEKFLTPLPPRWPKGLGKQHVLYVACGGYHILVSSRNPGQFQSTLYTSGINQYGQLGHGDNVQRHELTPVKALEGQNIVKTAAGEHFSVAMNIDGSIIWAFGRNDYGQLGISDVMQDVGNFEITPQQVSFPDDSGDGSGRALLFQDIDAGDRHVLALTDQGEVYSWGFGEMGVTGHKGSEDSLRPRKLDVSKDKDAMVRYASGGGQHSLMIVS